MNPGRPGVCVSRASQFQEFVDLSHIWTHISLYMYMYILINFDDSVLFCYKLKGYLLPGRVLPTCMFLIIKFSFGLEKIYNNGYTEVDMVCNIRHCSKFLLWLVLWNKKNKVYLLKLFVPNHIHTIKCYCTM